MREFKPGVFRMGRCSVVVAMNNAGWTLSISCRTNSPSYKEIKEARYKYIPDETYMVQLFPPIAELKDIHPYTHHLFEIKPLKEKTMGQSEYSNTELLEDQDNQESQNEQNES